MATLWDRLTKKPVQEVAAELQIFNPLKLKIGDPVKIDLFDGGTDLSRINFTVIGIQVVTREIDGRDHKMVDYDVLGRTLDNQEHRRTLRLIPLENPDAEVTHGVILLRQLDGFGYNEGFHAGLDFGRNGGEFREGDKVYYRPNVAGTQEMVKTPWEAVTTSVRDEDRSGKVDPNEIRTGKLTYWDFGNEFKNDAGQPYIEWYIVNMDGSGYFTIVVGPEVDLGRISVI